jgi:hypothetical protein
MKPEENDVVIGDFYCPRCNSKLDEKRPKDKFIVRNKTTTVRLSCKCGYYEDRVMNIGDFLDN